MIQVGDGPPQPLLHLTGDQLVPGVHVPPFSTAELREGIPMGARFEYRITRPDYPTVLSTWDVTQHGPEEFTFRVTDAREDGTLFAPPRDESRYWVELRNRSAFPKVDYDKTEVEVRFRGKPTKGWLYESKARAGAPIERTWFSSASPGPPVLFTVHESGRETMRRELLSRSP